ncbi:MAG: hypothetical protein ACOC5R_05595 [Elusimicrobiota bacterium]
MKISFKVLGVSVILIIGLSFIHYANTHNALAKAKREYKVGEFNSAEMFFQKAEQRLKSWALFNRTSVIKRKAMNASLMRIQCLYNAGYYQPEQYALSEQLADKALNEVSSDYGKDQLYNLKALLFWQKGVELFIELGEQAADSEKIDEFIEGARENSAQAVMFNDGTNWNIKYNYEFFRLSKQELKKRMQQAAKNKQAARARKQKMKKARAKKKQVQKGKSSKKGEKEKVLVPKQKDDPDKSSDKKKKKKG